MKITYTKLWKLLIDKGINKTKLCEKANISTNAMAKLGKNESVKTDILIRICNALDCELSDIMETCTEDDKGEQQ